MSLRPNGPVNRPATIGFCLMLLCAAVAVLTAATAQAAQFKMVACASDSGAPPFATATNTTSPSNPSGIFEFNNWCGRAGGDPPGDAAFFRINENQSGGNAGPGASGHVVFTAPAFIAFKAAGGYTRQPNAFNLGWRARFWVVDLDQRRVDLLAQGAKLPNSGINAASSNIFAPHLWPFPDFHDFYRFVYELECDQSTGCDRANYNATDANGFVFTLDDRSPSQVSFTDYNPQLLKGAWVRGRQGVIWDAADEGSGLRIERLLIDGAQRHAIESACDVGASQLNLEWARSYSPCPTGGPWRHGFEFDTAILSDGGHSLSICTQDYGQYQGLNGTKGETCDSRTVRVDNNPPGPPAGLHVISSNSARYLSRFGARFTLPPDPGSPITKVHYDIVNAAGEIVKPEQVVLGVNPTEIADIAGPAKAGDYRLRVWLEDEVGLRGPAVTAPIPHDTTPPAAPQRLSVTAPQVTRTAEAFDAQWRNISDTGSPIRQAHYQVIGNGGEEVVATKTTDGTNPQAISDLETPRGSGHYTLRVWLSDDEGNVGVPTSAPLAYDCVRSEVSGGLSLTAGLGEKERHQVVLPSGRGTTVSGTLSKPGGGLSGAPLCVFSRAVTDRDQDFLGIAITSDKGTYRFPLPPGPSRLIDVAYRPDQRQIEAQSTLLARVRPTFEITRNPVRNKHYAHFTGQIPAPHNDGVTVVLQVKSGKGWRAFRRYRTRRSGRYVMRYRFTSTDTPTTYIMRAQVRDTVGYPYLEGNSRALPLTVLP